MVPDDSDDTQKPHPSRDSRDEPEGPSTPEGGTRINRRSALQLFAVMGGIGAVRTALVSYVVPVVTAIAAWVVVGEAITLHTVAGFLVIAVGFALTERRTLLSGLRERGMTTDA
jgi:hypothetical protein